MGAVPPGRGTAGEEELGPLVAGELPYEPWVSASQDGDETNLSFVRITGL